MGNPDRLIYSLSVRGYLRPSRFRLEPLGRFQVRPQDNNEGNGEDRTHSHRGLPDCPRRGESKISILCTQTTFLLSAAIWFLESANSSRVLFKLSSPLAVSLIASSSRTKPNRTPLPWTEEETSPVLWWTTATGTRSTLETSNLARSSSPIWRRPTCWRWVKKLLLLFCYSMLII